MSLTRDTTGNILNYLPIAEQSGVVTSESLLHTMKGTRYCHLGTYLLTVVKVSVTTQSDLQKPRFSISKVAQPIRLQNSSSLRPPSPLTLDRSVTHK